MAGFGSAPTATLPTVGVTVGPTWASNLNTAIAELQAIVTPKLTNANLNITDADILHGTRIVRVGPQAAAKYGSPALNVTTAWTSWLATGSGDVVVFAIPLAENDHLTEVSAWGQVAVATAWAITLYRVNSSTGARASVSSGVSATTAAISKKTLAGLNETVAANIHYALAFEFLASDNQCWGFEFKFDKAATP